MVFFPSCLVDIYFLGNRIITSSQEQWISTGLTPMLQIKTLAQRRYVSLFSKIEMAGADPILSLTTAYVNDPKPHSYKINLGVGAYRDERGKPWVLESVKKAELLIQEDHLLNHEYIPITGTNEFVSLVQNFLFGQAAMPCSKQLLDAERRIVTGQGLSGTGSLRVLAEFLDKQVYKGRGRIAIPNPTWANHESIFHNAGLEVSKYAYYDPTTQGLNLARMLEDLDSMQAGDCVLLHVCCHNPTGVDPSSEEWDQILALISEKNLLPLFDMAYQGFAKGIFEDLLVVEKVSRLIKSGSGLQNALFAQSFAKNMGLYGERVGSFSIITANEDEKLNVQSQLKRIVRSMYSSPPSYGSKIVEKILGNRELYLQWFNEVSLMRNRLKEMRQLLFNELAELECRGPGKGPTGWEHLITQNGMFCFTGLTPTQVAALQKESIYMTRNGRISVAGINHGNVRRLATAIAGVM